MEYLDVFRLNKSIDKYSLLWYTGYNKRKGFYKMFEYSIRSKYTGEHDIIFGYSLAGALRDAGLSDEEWECYHVYDDFEEERVW